MNCYAFASPGRRVTAFADSKRSNSPGIGVHFWFSASSATNPLHEEDMPGPSTTASGAAAADLEKIPIEQVFAKLEVKPDQGLSAAEAQRRLGTYGPNAIVEHEQSLLAKIVGHFTGPIAYMIEAAAIVSAVI